MAVDDSYTKLLLHCDGADASTTFTDESGKTVTVNGGAQIDTADSKFGGASGKFAASGDYLSIGTSADLALGSGDWTIDFWAKINSAGQPATPYVATNIAWAANSWGIHPIHTTDRWKLWAYNFDQANPTLEGTSDSTNDTWTHVAFVRSGNTLYLFVNGIQEDTAAISGAIDGGSTHPLNLMGASYGNETLGWLDEFRFSKGIARWTANFTPPTSAYAPASGPANMGNNLLLNVG